MKHLCGSCGLNWLRLDGGKTRCCQRCGADLGWIKQEKFDAEARLVKRLNDMNFPVPPVVSKISPNRDPARFGKPVLVLPESLMPSSKLVAEIKIRGRSFNNLLDLDKIVNLSNSPNEPYIIFMCDGKLYRDKTLIDARKLFSSFERGANLREVLFFLLYYPDVLTDYFIISPDSRDVRNYVPCIGVYDGDLRLTNFFLDKSHVNVGFATAEKF